MNNKIIKQPVESLAWKKKGSVYIREIEGKFFYPVVEYIGITESGLMVSSRSLALKHAFDSCNAQKLRVVAVFGVRSDKYKLWK